MSYCLCLNGCRVVPFWIKNLCAKAPFCLIGCLGIRMNASKSYVGVYNSGKNRLGILDTLKI